MTRNRFFCYIVVACTLVFSLTGCGSKYAAATPAPASDTETETSTEEFEPFDGEGAVQGGIKSDEEIAALQEEEQQYASEAASEEEPAAFVDNAGHEPESYGSGNFQDYWKGDSYFDIVSYLRDNGAERVYATNGESYNPVEPGETIKFYVAEYGYWTVVCMCNAGIELCHVEIDSEGFCVADPDYTISMPLYGRDQEVTVDENGTTAIMEAICILDTTIQYMKANPDSDDPLKGSELNYIK